MGYLAHARGQPASGAHSMIPIPRSRQQLCWGMGLLSVPLRMAAPESDDMFPQALVDRYWSRVDQGGPDECWRWTGPLNRKGYGVFGCGITNIASRFAVLIDGREIPPQMVVDHICKVRCCVNPAHLRVVTHRFNCIDNSDSPVARNSRKTHCPKGHPLSGDNLDAYYLRLGWRSCRECKRARKRAKTARARMANAQTPSETSHDQ